MKLHKSGLILIIVGVVVVAGFLFGMKLVQQSSAQQDLQTQLSLAKKKSNAINLAALTAQKDQLTAQIAQSDTQIQAIKIQLSSSRDSIDVTDTLLADAQTCNVSILELTSPGISTENVAGTPCQVIPVSLSVNGTVDDIANFVYSLCQVFPTSVVKSADIQINPILSPTPTPSPTEASDPSILTPAEPSPVIVLKETDAKINLVIYNYEGE